ncbi:hypothetical protein GGF42_003866 [Coemansia sp. RSA 2424]|nr:hypothetical protein GGF42_003866 [Coemansia sp. RSA 2424]
MLATAEPIYLDIAHSLGYDSGLAASAGAAASNGISELIGGLRNIDQFKPIIHPDVASSINLVESLGGLISSLVGYVVKIVVGSLYSSNILDNIPYIGQLIKSADAMITPEYKQVFGSLEIANIAQIAK